MASRELDLDTSELGGLIQSAVAKVKGVLKKE